MRPWKANELNKCKILYSTRGLKSAVRFTRRTPRAVRNQMFLMGVKCKNQSPIKLQTPLNFTVDDVALMFEFSASKVKRSLIAEYMDCSVSLIDKTMNKAKKYGMAKFQKGDE